MEIPGIGAMLCATILAEVGDIKRFSSFNKFYAYTGLEPRRFETGDSVSRDKVSHEWSRHLRVVFYKNMQVIIKNNPEWYSYYKRKRANKETCVTYGHVIKKVLKAIYFITKNGLFPYALGGLVGRDIEIKFTSNPQKKFLNNFRVLQKKKKKIGTTCIICSSSEISSLDSNNLVVPYFLV